MKRFLLVACLLLVDSTNAMEDMKNSEKSELKNPREEELDQKYGSIPKDQLFSVILDDVKKGDFRKEGLNRLVGWLDSTGKVTEDTIENCRDIIKAYIGNRYLITSNGVILGRVRLADVHMDIESFSCNTSFWKKVLNANLFEHLFDWVFFSRNKDVGAYLIENFPFVVEGVDWPKLTLASLNVGMLEISEMILEKHPHSEEQTNLFECYFSGLNSSDGKLLLMNIARKNYFNLSNIIARIPLNEDLFDGTVLLLAIQNGHRELVQSFIQFLNETYQRSKGECVALIWTMWMSARASEKGKIDTGLDRQFAGRFTNPGILLKELKTWGLKMTSYELLQENSNRDE